MNTKMRKLASATLVALAMSASSAHSAIVLDDWTLNLSGVDGLGATVINGIDQIEFTGVSSSHALNNNSGLPAVGTVSRSQGLLSANSFQHDGNIIFGTGLNSTYEMTFTFDVAGVTTIVNGTDTSFTHLAAGAAGDTGLLNIYVNKVGGSWIQSNQTTGNGYTDGVKIASFKVNAGLGGVFSFITLNGSDDASFSLDWALGGVLFDKDGNDLSFQPGKTLLVTASQYDASIANNGIPDVPCPTNGSLGTAQDALNFCAQENGRASLQVPEPGSMALIGLALAGLGISRRKAAK